MATTTGPGQPDPGLFSISEKAFLLFKGPLSNRFGLSRPQAANLVLEQVDNHAGAASSLGVDT